jgi:hypothetical protein
MSQYHRKPKRRASRPARMNQHTPPPRCRLCVWFEDCLKIRRPMLPDCDVFLNRGDQGLPRTSEGDLQQTLTHLEL